MVAKSKDLLKDCFENVNFGKYPFPASPYLLLFLGSIYCKQYGSRPKRAV